MILELMIIVIVFLIYLVFRIVKKREDDDQDGFLKCHTLLSNQIIQKIFMFKKLKSEI